MNDYLGELYARQDLVMRFSSELIMGLYETVEIQSATTETRIIVRDRIACIVGGDTSFAGHIWPVCHMIYDE